MNLSRDVPAYFGNPKAEPVQAILAGLELFTRHKCCLTFASRDLQECRGSCSIPAFSAQARDCCQQGQMGLAHPLGKEPALLVVAWPAAPPHSVNASTSTALSRWHQKFGSSQQGCITFVPGLSSSTTRSSVTGSICLAQLVCATCACLFRRPITSILQGAQNLRSQQKDLVVTQCDPDAGEGGMRA